MLQTLTNLFGAFTTPAANQSDCIKCQSRDGDSGICN